jgi:hypothetical protein
MTLTSTIPFFSIFFRLFFRTLAHWLEDVFRALLQPPPQARVRGPLTDLTFTKAELITDWGRLDSWEVILYDISYTV